MFSLVFTHAHNLAVMTYDAPLPLCILLSVFWLTFRSAFTHVHSSDDVRNFLSKLLLVEILFRLFSLMLTLATTLDRWYPPLKKLLVLFSRRFFHS